MTLDVNRIILTYIIQVPIVFFFSILAIQLLRRNRSLQTNLLVGFLISVIIGNITNMVYAVLENEFLIIFLHLCVNFFNFYGLGFLYILNRIFLDSEIVYSRDRQIKYMLIYGSFYIIGMFSIGLNGGVTLSYLSYPVWNVYFYIFMLGTVFGFGIFPILNTSIKILRKIQAKNLRRRFLQYFFGVLGMASIILLIFTINYLNDNNIRTIVSIYIISTTLWVWLIQRGLGRKL
jgi:MFS family permease